MIKNGCDTPLSSNPGTLPDVSDALLDWFQPIVLKQIVKTTVDFKTVETKFTISSKGVEQPLTAQQLDRKPEGQRKWKWIQIHCLKDVVLSLDDQVEYEGENYRVLGKYDYSKYGYFHYEFAQDYNA